MCRAEKDRKAKFRLLVFVMRKDGDAIREIERILLRPYSTIRNWLVRAAEHGLAARTARSATGSSVGWTPTSLNGSGRI